MTEYILSLSYGKDSIAFLEAIRQLGWPLDRIVHAEVWATDTIPADLPPMVEFKAYADAIIKERYGIEVEHVCAMKDGEKVTYEKLFYHELVRKCKIGGGTSDSRWCAEHGATADSKSRRCGWPHQVGSWCNSRLKIPALRMATSGRELVQKAQAPLCTDGQRSSEDGASVSSRWNGAATFHTSAGSGARG